MKYSVAAIKSPATSSPLLSSSANGIDSTGVGQTMIYGTANAISPSSNIIGANVIDGIISIALHWMDNDYGTTNTISI